MRHEFCGLFCVENRKFSEIMREFLIIEIHIHTRYSKDSLLNKYFLWLFCKLKKINCIVITDHNNISSLKYKCFLEKRRIQVIIGEEIMTQEGEVIGLFLKNKIMPMMTLKHTIQEIKNQGGLVYVPHPVDCKRKKTILNSNMVIQYASDIDFVEIYNGRISSDKDIEKTEKLCNKLLSINPEIVAVVGSDAHICWELGRNIGVIAGNGVLNINNFKSTLRNAKFKRKKQLFFAHKWTKFIKLIRIFSTFETMKYDVASMKEIINRSRFLAKYIKENFSPEIIIFVAKGGFLIGKTVSEFFQIPLYDVSTERHGGKFKRIIAPIFKVLPIRFRFWMIDIEMNMKLHKNASARKVVVSNELKNLSVQQEKTINNILIIDDSVDTGNTAIAVKREIQKLFPNANIKFAALSCIRFSEPIFYTDYYLYKDTIIKTATSKDSSEYISFIDKYIEWKKNHL